MKISRAQVPAETIYTAICGVTDAVKKRLEEKGYGTFSGKHEVFGILSEEFDELRGELREDMCIDGTIAELEDIAVAAIFGMASLMFLNEKAVDNMDQTTEAPSSGPVERLAIAD